jgi:UDP-3-O-[3-hydroxymyristoyl] N-acetylglucosamine deacetylase
MRFQQQTIARSVCFSGVGVHSGKTVNVIIHPAPVNHGIKFVRTDIPDHPSIPARFNMIVDTSLATVIGYDGVIVSTIEHLMASFTGLSIDNARVELDNYEMPIMDGSAGPFTRLIQSVGAVSQDGPRHVFRVTRPIELEQDGKFVGVYPSDRFKITCTVEYDHPLIQKQSYSIEINELSFAREICNARTFGFYHEVEYMKRCGLARGGSLANAVVLSQDTVLNVDGLRYPDEFVRHKLLDCIGDFSMMGLPILGHLVTCRSGHAFHHRFLEKFFEEKSSWETWVIPCSTDGCPSKADDRIQNRMNCIGGKTHFHYSHPIDTQKTLAGANCLMS